MDKSLAIVDAYRTTGRYLSRAFRRRGWKAVHVQSTANPLDCSARGFNRSDFAVNLVHRRSLSRLVAELKKHHLQAVIPGAESGVVLADALADALRLPWNSRQTTCLRRKKNQMHDALRRSGLRALMQLLATNGVDVRRWPGTQPSREAPVVTKPVDDAGGRNVTLHTCPVSTARAIDQLRGRNTNYDSVINEVLLQEYVVGEEWVCNAVTWQGRHKITDLWRIDKTQVDGVADGVAIAYDRSELRPGDGRDAEALMDYTRSALDVLGVRYGASHSELIVDAQGPVLIEVNARLPGTMDPEIMNRALGTNQIDELVGVLTDPGRFDWTQKLIPRYHVTKVHLLVDRRGVVRALPIVDDLKRLSTYHSHYLTVGVGDRVGPTVSLASSPGSVFLLGSEKEVINDYETIRDLEENGGIQFAD